MTLFQSSSQTGAAPRYKVLLWGSQGAGKTHFIMGAPKLALLDIENRARNFALRGFDFLHAELPTLADVARAMKEIGSIDCESIGVDSGSAFYLKLVEEHTTATSGGAYVTDWVTVNRRFLSFLNLIFSIAGRNVLVAMHASDKLKRQGRDFQAAGQDFVGDTKRFRYAFDYVFRLESKGNDPSKTLFHIEKTSSPALRIGDALPGLTFCALRELTAGASTAESVAPPSSSAAPSPDEPIAQHQHQLVVDLASDLKINNSELATLVKAVTRRTPIIGELSSSEAVRLIAVLQKRKAA
jgi:hypothetical protein